MVHSWHTVYAWGSIGKQRARRWTAVSPRPPPPPPLLSALQGVGLKHLTGDVKSILNRITDISQVGSER